MNDVWQKGATCGSWIASPLTVHVTDGWLLNFFLESISAPYNNYCALFSTVPTATSLCSSKKVGDAALTGHP